MTQQPPPPEIRTAPPRTLPHNLEAERSVLGAILIDNDVWDIAASRITAPDFFRDAHGRIWKAFETLRNQERPLDLVCSKEELERVGDLEEVGGPAYIASLVDGVPRSTNVEYYADIVREKARLRSIIFEANKLLGNAYEAEDSSADIVEKATLALSLSIDAGLTGAIHIRDAIKQYMVDLDAPQGILIPTGLIDLDAKIGGIERRKLSIVAARPSVGKTSLALSWADNIAGRGDAVGIISIEMDPASLGANVLSAHSGVSTDRLRRRSASQEDWQKISSSLEQVFERNIYIVHDVTTLTQVAAWSRRLRDQFGVRIIFIDYIQLMGDLLSVNRQREVAHMSRGLKKLAVKDDLAIVALSQLSRESERRNDKRPHLSDLRESGALEQDADLVALLYREEMHKPKPENEGVGEIIIAKNRSGPVATIKATFMKETAKWANYADPTMY